MKPLRLPPRFGLADVAILCLVGGVIATVVAFAREFEAPFVQAIQIDLRPTALATAGRLGPGLRGGPVYTDDRAPVEWLIDESIVKVAAEGSRGR